MPPLTVRGGASRTVRDTGTVLPCVLSGRISGTEGGRSVQPLACGRFFGGHGPGLFSGRVFEFRLHNGDSFRRRPSVRSGQVRLQGDGAEQAGFLQGRTVGREQRIAPVLPLSPGGQTVQIRIVDGRCFLSGFLCPDVSHAQKRSGFDDDLRIKRTGGSVDDVVCFSRPGERVALIVHGGRHAVHRSEHGFGPGRSSPGQTEGGEVFGGVERSFCPARRFLLQKAGGRKKGWPLNSAAGWNR